MIAPTLQTDRLTLRVPVLADFPAYADFMASPRAVFMGGPMGQIQIWGAFCHDLACWALFGHGGLMVDLRLTGQTIGQVGINAGPLFPEPELGWMLYDGHESKGYATEAATGLRNWAFSNLQHDSFVSYIDLRNTASARVAERLGAILDAAAPRPPGDEADLVYRHRRPS